jgi:IclR family acetate operon transcriptional repressor
VNLAILDGLQILYLDVIESSHTFRFASQIGARRPLHCTALGKAMLAHMPENELKELLPALRFERLTQRTFTQPAKFRKELSRTRLQGYALDDEEAVLGARCIAAPVFDVGGRVLGGISVSGPLTRITQERIPTFAAIVKKAAQSVSSRLGYQQSKGAAVSSQSRAQASGF